LSAKSSRTATFAADEVYRGNIAVQVTANVSTLSPITWVSGRDE
jgi:hypothetical protein